MNIADVQSVIASAVGGENIGETVEGLQRFPINVRYPRELRDSLERAAARCRSSRRAARGWCSSTSPTSASATAHRCSEARTRALRAGCTSTSAAAICTPPLRTMQRAVAEKVQLPAGYSISWSGQFEFLERATAKLKIVVPFTLLIIFVLLYLTFRRFDEALLIMAALPFALIGGIWLLYLLGLQPVGGRGRRLHRAGRRRRRVRRDHAAVSEAGVARRGSLPARPMKPTCSRRSAKARCCACDPRR